MFALFEDLRQKKSNANITTILACWPLEHFFLPLGQLKGRESKDMLFSELTSGKAEKLWKSYKLRL